MEGDRGFDFVDLVVCGVLVGGFWVMVVLVGIGLSLIF